jgi:hypothetical protein
LIERCGPIEVIAQKSRIAIMARVRFAGATVLRDRVRLNIALTRRLDEPWVERVPRRPLERASVRRRVA